MTPEEMQAAIDAGTAAAVSTAQALNELKTIALFVVFAIVFSLLLAGAGFLIYLALRNQQRSQQFNQDTTRETLGTAQELRTEVGILRTHQGHVLEIEKDRVEIDAAKTKLLANIADVQALTVKAIETLTGIMNAIGRTIEAVGSGQGEIKKNVQVMPEIIKLNTREQLDEQSIHVLEKINQSLEAGVTPKVGIVQINSEGRVVLVNPVALKLLGLTTEQTVGKPFYNLGLKVVNSDGKALEDFASLPFAEALKTRQLTIKHAIIGIQTQDKSYKWIAMEMQLIDGSEVTTPQILLMFVDAGEIVTMEGATTGSYPKEPGAANSAIEHAETAIPAPVTPKPGDEIHVTGTVSGTLIAADTPVTQS